jgi:hypothetical protein
MNRNAKGKSWILSMIINILLTVGTTLAIMWAQKNWH